MLCIEREEKKKKKEKRKRERGREGKIESVRRRDKAYLILIYTCCLIC